MCHPHQVYRSHYRQMLVDQYADDAHQFLKDTCTRGRGKAWDKRAPPGRCPEQWDVRKDLNAPWHPNAPGYAPDSACNGAQEDPQTGSATCGRGGAAFCALPQKSTMSAHAAAAIKKAQQHKKKQASAFPDKRMKSKFSAAALTRPPPLQGPEASLQNANFQIRNLTVQREALLRDLYKARQEMGRMLTVELGRDG